MKKNIVVFCVVLILSFEGFANAKLKKVYKSRQVQGSPVQFNDVWGWVMQNREKEFKLEMPVTDIGYFAAEVDCYGELDSVPNPSRLGDFKGRVHLVLTTSSKTQTHLVVDPKLGMRDKMIKDIMKASEKFSGVQVDYELIPKKDSANFFKFLELLSVECRKKGKIFSVCVPARNKEIPNDIFPYKKISEICDKVIIMAYDEHWSTSAPGPIASVDWCERIVNYAITVIPMEKLVMGLPTYGRSWANEKVAQAWYFDGIERIMKQYKPGKVKYENDIPNVQIEMKVNANLWFEDTYSIMKKVQLYKSKDVQNIAFWRIGLEDPSLWDWIQICK